MHSSGEGSSKDNLTELESEAGAKPMVLAPFILKVTCPVCQLKMPSVEIEAHADSCAERLLLQVIMLTLSGTYLHHLLFQRQRTWK